MRDFCAVLLVAALTVNAQISYTALRIVVRDSTHIDSLVMNTDQDTTLKAQGLRSDNGHWEAVAATWQASPGLLTVPPFPVSASTVAFSPLERGVGWIRVTRGNDAVTRPDTVFATFAPGSGPCRIWSQMLAPLDKTVAGDTSVFEVVGIDCVDPSVPDVWCDSMTITDTLGSGPGQPQPFAIVNGNRVPFGTSFAACFHGGRDTIRVILFSAPASPDDSFHQIDLQWRGLAWTSGLFRLKPSTVSRIEIQQPGNSTPVDSVVLTYPAGYVTLTCVGYDAYGNKRGVELADWVATGTLHSIQQSKNIGRIYYDASTVTSDEEGYVYCSSSSDSTIRDSVKIRIAGPAGVLWMNRTSQSHYLRVITQDGSAMTLPIPPDLEHDKVFFSLYSLAGRMICSVAIDKVTSPVSLKSPLQPGTYIARFGTKNRLAFQSRFVIVK